MAKNNDTRRVGLALQGGGAHAAFTWGVLDRLLNEVEKGELSIVAISGTSGGALNGAACAYGLHDCASVAKQALTQLWTLVGEASLWHPFYNFPNDVLRSPPECWNVDLNPMVIWQGMLQQVSSPYATPWLIDSIGSIMEKVIPDFDVINKPGPAVPELFVAATDVNLTALRIFGPGEHSAKTLMASTCSPTLYEAIEIGGHFYWDGGYMANPPLNPLVDRADDILSILIDPLFVEQAPPQLPRQIVNRINELSFGASWVNEVNQIELINELRDENDNLTHRGKSYTKKRFHVIRADGFMDKIGASSKSTPCIEFFSALRDAGRAAAEAWIRECLPQVGKATTFDLKEIVKKRTEGTDKAIRTVHQAERLRVL